MTERGLLSVYAARRAWLRLGLLVLIGGMVLAGTARAADFPPAFVVSDMPVSGDGKTGSAARDAARTAGQQAALQEVLQRLTNQADWGRLPKPSADATTDLVQDFQVQKEHVSPTHYVGVYTFRFNPAGIRLLLQSANIGFTELVSKPVVVVPLYQIGNATHLWDDPNPWRDAWNLANGRAGLVPWNLPLGDIGDVQVFDVPEALNPTPQALAALSKRYDGGDPVVAKAVETDTPQSASLAITVTRYTPGSQPVSTTTSVSAAKPDPALYAAGVEAARRALEELWKQNALLPSLPAGNAQPFQITVPVTGAQQWAEISGKLAHVDGVQNPIILMMSRDSVVLRVDLAADPQSMRLAFAQQDLLLTPSDSGATLQLLPPGTALPALTPTAAPAAAPAPAPISAPAADQTEVVPQGTGYLTPPATGSGNE